jgi:hypothetical protein
MSTVDQILYLWDDANILGQRGYGPVASSLTRHEALTTVDRGLAALARMADSADSAGPSWSVCHVRTRDFSAILRRTRDPQVNRSDIGHALIFGEPPVPTLALALAQWPGWYSAWEPGIELRSFSDTSLSEYAAQRAAELDERATQWRTEMIEALAVCLATPDRQHGIIVPSGVPPEDTSVLLWGIQQILGTLTQGIRNPMASYTTYAQEMADPNYGSLDLVCAPDPQTASSFGTKRAVSRPFKTSAVDRETVATQLVGRYCDGGTPALRDLLQQHRVLDQPKLTARIANLRSLSSTAQTRPPTPAVRTPAVPALTVPSSLPPEPSRPPGKAPNRHHGQVNAETPDPPETPPSSEARWVVMTLLDGSIADLRTKLSDFAHHAERLDPQSRRELCHVLVERRFRYQDLRHELSRADRSAVLQTMTVAALGPDPRLLGADEWRPLLAANAPDEVVDRICERAEDLGVIAPLLPWLELRHLHRLGFRGYGTVPLRRRLAAIGNPVTGTALFLGLFLGVLLAVLITT